MEGKVAIGQQSKSEDVLMIRALPVDDYFDHRSGAVKVDVEGGELSVLRGAQRMLAQGTHTPLGGVVDLIPHQASAGDSEGLGRAIIDLCSSPENCRLLRNAAQETARMHGWDRIAERRLECYRGENDAILRRRVGRA